MATRQAGPLIRRLVSTFGAEMILALAVVCVVIFLPAMGGRVSDILTSIGLAVLLLALPVVEALGRRRLIIADGLPGVPGRSRRPSLRQLRVGAGVALLLVVVAVSLGAHRPALVLIAVVDAALAVTALESLIAFRRVPRVRAALTAALIEYAPQFVIYTARRNDASYQLAMWLPELAKLEVPFIVVVRHQAAVGYARSVTSVPVICCPSGPDLDAVVVPSLRAAFYVNGVADNAGFVGYRSLRHVYLGHGDSDKELSVHPMHAMFDQVFVAGQAAIDRYPPAGVRIERDKFVLVGRPQLARLQGPQRQPGSALAPRVLFAPTWRGYNARTTLSSLPVAAGVVGPLLDAGATVVFRPHPFSWLGSEREQIDAVDTLLRTDRDATGRPHRLAAENRSTGLQENFDGSDALVSDIGSVLVDYFATGKPYAVVLPAGTSADLAREAFSSVAAAYLIGRTPEAGLPRWVDELLHTDPLAGRRAEIARYYLGERTRDDEPFLTAVRALLTGSVGPSLSAEANGSAGTTGQRSQDPGGAAAEAELFGESGEDARVRGGGR